jgi:hypothetical protein
VRARVVTGDGGTADATETVGDGSTTSLRDESKRTSIAACTFESESRAERVVGIARAERRRRNNVESKQGMPSVHGVGTEIGDGDGAYFPACVIVDCR